MKIVFILPKLVYSQKEFYDLPLGILYVATYLKSNGYDVSILNLNSYADRSERDVIENYLSLHEVNIMMCGGLSAAYQSIKNIFDIFKNLESSILTVLGGGIVTSDKEFICNHIKPDYAVLGEGEITSLELVHALEKGSSVAAIKGLVHKQNGSYVYNTEREANECIDQLPYPDFTLIDIEEYFRRQYPSARTSFYPFDFPRAIPIITSRSCPLKCTFCFHPIGQKYRMRNLDNVFDEIDILVNKYNVNIIAVLDEMMSASKRRLIEFSERIMKYNILWTCQLWPGSVDDKTLKFMRDSGCYEVSFGLESINDDVLKSMQKHGVTRKNIESALRCAVDNRVTIQGNFIFGDPAETYETSQETIAWWKQHPEYKINLGKISPYPGTPLYKMALEKGIVTDKLKFIRSGSPALNLSRMSDDEYRNVVAEIEKISAEARQYCKVKSVKLDKRTEHEAYICELECPNCSSVVEYGNIQVSTPRIIRLGCRQCSLRFDFNPSSLPNLRRKIQQQKELLLDVNNRYKKIIISPRVYEDIFLEYFDLLELNYQDMNIVAIVDNNDTFHGAKYLGEYTIYKRDDELIDKFADAAILVMQSIYKYDIIHQFKELGFRDNDIYTTAFENENIH
ncbi:radical SAM protein [Ectothiorhodospiraceae bacterium BW-2]|nr:radical SAM protein [Ectothiorhodospiraceae bacterium BW-2]